MIEHCDGCSGSVSDPNGAHSCIGLETYKAECAVLRGKLSKQPPAQCVYCGYTEPCDNFRDGIEKIIAHVKEDCPSHPLKMDIAILNEEIERQKHNRSIEGEMHRTERDTLLARVKELEDENAALRERNAIILGCHMKERDTLLASLHDPVKVHASILLGDIALTRDQALHIAGATDYDGLRAALTQAGEAGRALLSATETVCYDGIKMWDVWTALDRVLALPHVAKP